MTNRFGFIVRRGRDFDSSAKKLVPNDNWVVELPHKCEEWSITDPYGGESHEEAVKSLQQFIIEAAGAMVALKNHEEIGEE